MPSISEQPEKLRGYVHHRLDITPSGSGQYNGDCPFCGGHKKWFVGADNGLYRCVVCPKDDGGTGNLYTFIRKLYEISSAPLDALEEVAHERKVRVETLQRWGLVRSAIDNEWMLPGYGLKGEINNLYRWTPMKQKDGTYKRRLLVTATLSHCLFGIQHWADSKHEAYILEGPWDAMALEDVTMLWGRNGGKWVRTSNPQSTFYNSVNIVAVPGCDVFRDDWLSRFSGKSVTLWYDSDRPRTTPQGKVNPPVGLTGMKTAAKKLKTVVAEGRFIQWGAEGFDEVLKDGHDVRDHLTTAV